MAKRCLVLLSPARDGEPSDTPPNVYQEFEPKEGRLRFNEHHRRKRYLYFHLLDNLSKGHLTATGVLISPRVESEPRSIPAAFFGDVDQPHVIDDWEANRLRRGEVCFGDVWIASENAGTPQQREVGSGSGRKPSSGIEKAIEDCEASVSNFWGLTRKQQCDEVRRQIHGADVDNTIPPKGYKDGAIKKRLRSLDPSQKS